MRKYTLLLLLCISGFVTASAQERILKTWIVADSKMACQLDDAITSCYRIKEHPDSNWTQFPWTIEGFLHDKGTEYIIEVYLDKIAYPVDNGPKYTYTLNRIVSQKNNVLTDKRLLANNRFKLINIEEYGKMKLAVKSKAEMVFNIDSNRISGYSGCNNFNVSCSYATAFLQFGEVVSTKKTCEFAEIESKMLAALAGKATFYVRNKMLFIVCENFMTLHLKPEKSLDSIIAVLEAEKAPKNDIHFSKNDDGTYLVNAPNEDNRLNLIIPCKKTMVPEKATKGAPKLMTFTPIAPGAIFLKVVISNKQHPEAHMHYATVYYKSGKKREVSIRDASN